MTLDPRAPRHIWAAVPTPFRPDGGLDLDGVAHNARHFADSLGLEGVFCNGLMGEGWSLDVDERRSVVEAIVGATGGRLRVGVVVTHHALSETLALARHAGGAGADHIVLMRPRGPFSDDELIGFVEAAIQAAGLPGVLFEASAPGMSFGASVVERLARAGRIVSVKATGGSKAVAALRRACGDAVVIADPHEECWLDTLLRHDLRVLYADPEPYLFQHAGARPIADYYDAYRRGDVAGAAAISRSLEPLRRIYDRWIIGRLDRGLAPNAALKLWCARLGLAAGPVRPPLAPLAAADRQALEAELTEAGIAPPQR